MDNVFRLSILRLHKGLDRGQEKLQLGDVLDNKVKVPLELLSQVDLLVDYLDFESREAFVETAIQRLIDFYSSLMPSLTMNKIIT